MEVHLARAFADSGHQVHVVTSTVAPAYVKQIKPGSLSANDMDGEVIITRLKPLITLGQITITRGVLEAVFQSKPDLIVVIGLGKYFPKPVYKAGIPILTLLGDNAHSYKAGSIFQRFKTRILFELFKKSVYRIALRKSYRLVAYTPESFSYAGKFLGMAEQLKLANEKHFVSLGFPHDDFFFDFQLREKNRAMLGFEPGQIIVITATRVVPEKHLENFLPQIKSLPSNFLWLVVGSDGGAYTKSFAEKATTILGKGRFKMLPFRERNGLNALYNAADIAFYTVSAISVFEALGAGLPCVLPQDKGLSHVLAFSQLAAAFEPYGTDALHTATIKIYNREAEMLNSMEKRQQRAALAKKHFSWQGISQRLIEIAALADTGTTRK
jgi:glycosyltransferase involved in cell wall biosynthesis